MDKPPCNRPGPQKFSLSEPSIPMSNGTRSLQSFQRRFGIPQTSIWMVRSINGTRSRMARGVFILNVTDLAAAHEMLEKLPLGQAHLMSFELIPLGPLAPLRRLTPSFIKIIPGGPI